MISDYELFFVTDVHCFCPQAERLSEYEQYFAALVVDTHPDHPDRPHLTCHRDTAANVSDHPDRPQGHKIYP